MNHELIVLDTAQAVASLTAATIADLLSGFRSDRPHSRASVAFSGGNTPTQMLRILAGLADDPDFAARASDLTPDWSRVDVFQVDERVAPPDDAARNVVVLQATIGDTLVARENFHPMPVELGPDRAAEAYRSTLVDVLGERPAIDVIHLGLGADGHCASLVPGDPALDVDDRDVAATRDYQGHRRVTLTYPSLDRAKVIVWQVTGASKTEALAGLVAGDTSIPAGRVEPRRSIIIADRSAAAGL